MGDLLDTAAVLKLVEKSGSWFAYEGERLGQGRDNSVAWLEEHPEVASRLEAQVRQQSGLTPVEEAPDGARPDQGA